LEGSAQLLSGRDGAQPVGLHKIVHMQTEHGEGVALMKAVKTTLDPNGIMNPGKLYPR
jgi:D-lactate dehydrogenase (cytochrome)